MPDNTHKTFWDIINHNMTIGIAIIGVIFWVNAGDKPTNDAVIELTTKQVIIMEDIDKIKTNHLTHIQQYLNELSVLVASIEAKQQTILDKLK